MFIRVIFQGSLRFIRILLDSLGFFEILQDSSLFGSRFSVIFHTSLRFCRIHRRFPSRFFHIFADSLSHRNIDLGRSLKILRHWRFLLLPFSQICVVLGSVESDPLKDSSPLHFFPPATLLRYDSPGDCRRNK